ncbi:MAG TPA: hypothetical protein VH988_14150 [Thermoanaerobaculia bacterium]|nr:hypothetical protein [Thermoanaerobaculia bacterium]
MRVGARQHAADRLARLDLPHLRLHHLETAARQLAALLHACHGLPRLLGLLGLAGELLLQLLPLPVGHLHAAERFAGAGFVALAQRAFGGALPLAGVLGVEGDLGAQAVLVGHRGRHRPFRGVQLVFHVVHQLMEAALGIPRDDRNPCSAGSAG